MEGLEDLPDRELLIVADIISEDDSKPQKK
jgi:hypothetical protein